MNGDGESDLQRRRFEFERELEERKLALEERKLEHARRESWIRTIGTVVIGGLLSAAARRDAAATHSGILRRGRAVTPAVQPESSRARGPCGQRLALPTGTTEADGGAKGQNRTFLLWRKPDICTLRGQEPERSPNFLSPLPMHLKNGELELRLFSTVTTVGAPGDLTLDGLRIEAFVPVEAPADDALRALAQSA